MTHKLTYAQAVKAYYAKEGKPVSFPKKGSAEHSAIRALMASGDIAPGSGVSAEAALGTGEVKVRRPRKKTDAAPPKRSDDAPAKPETTTLIDQPHVDKKTLKEVVEEPEKKPVAKRKPRAVKADGLPPQQQQLKALTEQNSGMAVVPADYPGLKDQIKKVLEVKPEGIPETKKKEYKADITVSATQSHNTAPDRKAAEGRAPFSFSAIRQILRQ